MQRSMVLAAYIHNIDPVLVELGGPLAIRWYGLAYLAGFAAAYFLLLFLSRRDKFPADAEQIQNLVLLCGFAGVFLGGRLGYCLFYAWDIWRQDPLFPLKIWEGGMASHGGLIGVILALAWFARIHRMNFLALTDGFACVTPVGLFFGRLANFINGELWGRVTTSSWGMYFPQEAGLHDPTAWDRTYVLQLIEQGVVHLRHPSQLYQAFGEGLVLFAVLWALRFSRISRRPGVISAAFLVVYAVVRICAEFFREPDSTIYFGWMTKGQLLSLFMFAVAAILLAVIFRPSRRRNG